MSVKLLALCASRREGSHNYALLNHAAALAKTHGAELTLYPADVLDLPLYDDSMPTLEHMPDAVQKLAKDMIAADGIIIASPEYNWSMPAALKNYIDWISILRPIPFENKTALLLSASPSRRGGLQGLMQLRVPLEALHCHVFTRMLAVGDIHNAWNQEDAIFHEPDLMGECDALIRDFVAFTKAQKTV